MPSDSVDDDDCENSKANSYAASAAIELIEGAIRAATGKDGGAGRKRFVVRVENWSAFCKRLKFPFKAEKDVFNWTFSMLPEDAAVIQERTKLRPIAAPVENLSDK